MANSTQTAIQERLGGTLGLGAVHYQGGRDELSRKCRERDDEIDRLRAERDALKLKVERLVKALRPFSEYANCKCTCCNHDADVIAGPVTNDLNFTREITVGDLREADEAIKEAEGK